MPCVKIFQAKYEALSYTWGDKNDIRHIICNSSNRATTRNLFEAMQFLRYFNKIRVLWIDALCINQESDCDRTTQVKLMTQIYEGARQVLIWLGLMSPACSKAIDLIHMLDKVSALSKVDETQDGFLEEQHLIQAGLPNFGNSVWKDARDLFEQPWFFRVWILQEAVMARGPIFVCGPRKTQWTTFVNASNLLHRMFSDHPLRSSRGFIRLTYIDTWRLRQPWNHPGPCSYIREHEDFLLLLILERNSLASDARDKIFAFAGLLTTQSFRNNSDHQLIIKVDYSSDVADVYKNAVISLATYYGNLRFLSSAGSLQATKNTLPSWVPDWRVPLDRTPLMGLSICKEYNAYGDKSRVCNFRCQGNELLVKGVLIDYVQAVGPTLYAPTIIGSSGDVSVLRNWFEMVKRHNDNFHGSINPVLAHWQTINGMPLSSLETDCSGYSEQQCDCFETYVEFMQCDGRFCTTDNFQEKLDRMEPAQKRIAKYCVGRSFFITDEGYMGLGPG
jgi:Heterokaryon incompatibility protein (HET)